MKPNQRVGMFCFVALCAALNTSTVVHAQSSGGQALNLDGANDYVQLPPAVWFNGVFTVEGWVYVRSYNGWSRLIDFGNGPYNQNVYLALTEGGSGYPKMGVFGLGDGPLVGSSQPLPLNQWTHLAATLSGPIGTIYINGTNVGSGVLNVPANITRTNNYIGRSNWDGDGYANAIFDEVRIWNVARSPFQLQTFMGQRLSSQQTNLVGYWRFDETSGLQTLDSSGLARTGNLMGGASRTNSTAPIGPGFGTAVNLNGSAVVEIPHQPSLNAYPLTIMIWFKTTSAGGALVNKYVSGSYHGYQMFVTGDGQLAGWYLLNTVDNVFAQTTDAPPANDGQWHHAAFTLDASGGRIYLDGVLRANQPWAGTSGGIFFNSQPVSIAHYPGDSILAGQFDEMSIWNAALSADQIRAYATRGLVGTESNLLGYYPLNEGGGTFTADASGHGNNGTLNGGATWVSSLQPPTFAARTVAASGIAKTNAFLNGLVNPSGLTTTAWFEFGTTTNYGASTASASLNDGSIVERLLNATLTDLVPGTLYHYRVVATNSDGLRLGQDVSFRTRGAILTVTNLADTGPGSLRELIAGAMEDDDIHFAVNGTITLTGGELLLTKSLTIAGPGAALLSISGNNASRVFNITTTNANVAISGITIRDGRAQPGNPSGGGIFNSGVLVVSDCAVTGNHAGPGNGGPAGGGGGSGGQGGGVFNAGNISLFRCTFSENQAGPGGAGGDGYFAGIFFPVPPGPGGPGGVGGAIMNAGNALISQCTISSNSPGVGGIGGLSLFNDRAPSGGGGVAGGVFNALTLSIVACTVAQNSGPGILNAPEGSATLLNTIAALNFSNDSPDVAGSFISIGHNLIGQINGASGFTNGIRGDKVGSGATPLDPGLAAIGDYGGQTPTYRLLPGPATDAGDDEVLNAPYSLLIDQRGFSRKVGPHVDIGAVESEIVWSAPSAMTLPGTSSQDPGFGYWVGSLKGIVNAGGLETVTWFQFGLSTAYGGTTAAGKLALLNTNNTLVTAGISNLVESRTYHYRVVASNSLGVAYGTDQSFTTMPAPPVSGDLNGDGIVDQSEFSIVQSNYFLTSPWLQMTNAAGLGGSHVTFALTNTLGALSVEYSTSLNPTSWQFLGPATPRYEFTDTNAPASPQRYYRLRWP